MIPKLSLGAKAAPQGDDDGPPPSTSRREAPGGMPRGLGGLNLAGLGRSDPDCSATPRMSRSDDPTPRPGVSATPRAGNITRAASAYTATATATPRILSGTMGGIGSAEDSLNATSTSSRGGRSPTIEPHNGVVDVPALHAESRSSSSMMNGNYDNEDVFVKEARILPDHELRGALVAARKTIVQWESQYGDIVGHYREVVSDQLDRFEATMQDLETAHKISIKAVLDQKTVALSPAAASANNRRSNKPTTTSLKNASARDPADPRIRALAASPGPRRGASPATRVGSRHVDPVASRPPSRNSSADSEKVGKVPTSRTGATSLSSSRRADTGVLATGRRVSGAVNLAATHTHVPNTARRTPSSALYGSVRSVNEGLSSSRRPASKSSMNLRPSTPSMVQRRPASPSTTTTLNTSRSTLSASRTNSRQHQPIATARGNSRDQSPSTSRTSLFGYKGGDDRSSTPQMRKVMIPSTLTSVPYGSTRTLLNSQSADSPKNGRRAGATSPSPSGVHQSRGTGAPGYPPVEPHLVLRRSATPSN